MQLTFMQTLYDISMSFPQVKRVVHSHGSRWATGWGWDGDGRWEMGDGEEDENEMGDEKGKGKGNGKGKKKARGEGEEGREWELWEKRRKVDG